MAQSSKPIAPFFNSGTPLPIPALITSTELRHPSPQPLVTQEIFNASHDGARNKLQDPVCCNTNDADASDSESSVSSMSSGSDTDPDDGKIPPPGGEAGRRNRGGYNPEETLGWDTKRFKKVKVCLSSLSRNFVSA